MEVSNVLTQHLLGIIHAYEGRYEEAAAAFTQAAEQDPEMAGSYIELGLVYACLGEYQKMVEALRRAVGVSPSAVRAYLGEGPLGELPKTSPGDDRRHDPGIEDESGAVLSAFTQAISDMAFGRDDEAVARLGPAGRARGNGAPLASALLALAYLLRGDRLTADEDGVSLVATSEATGYGRGGARVCRRGAGDGG